MRMTSSAQQEPRSPTWLLGAIGLVLSLPTGLIVSATIIAGTLGFMMGKDWFPRFGSLAVLSGIWLCSRIVVRPWHQGKSTGEWEFNVRGNPIDETAVLWGVLVGVLGTLAWGWGDLLFN